MPQELSSVRAASKVSLAEVQQELKTLEEDVLETHRIAESVSGEGQKMNAVFVRVMDGFFKQAAADLSDLAATFAKAKKSFETVLAYFGQGYIEERHLAVSSSIDKESRLRGVEGYGGLSMVGRETSEDFFTLFAIFVRDFEKEIKAGGATAPQNARDAGKLRAPPRRAAQLASDILHMSSSRPPSASASSSATASSKPGRSPQPPPSARARRFKEAQQ
mmetsp:Transcript_43805/g.114237  ORF Transcript_43805/g.114237 Transcript_43805/m.114237 type:complete len:219 (-) Transcript_43805:1288-1944(-)